MLVTITCRGYRNPISPGNMLNYPVVVQTFDNEHDSKPISRLIGKLDPSSFFHVLIPNNALQVESVSTRSKLSIVIPATKLVPEKVDVQIVNSYKVMLYLPVPIPLEKECWIRINMPKSLSIVTPVAEMQGYGIFKSASGTTFTKAAPGD